MAEHQESPPPKRKPGLRENLLIHWGKRGFLILNTAIAVSLLGLYVLAATQDLLWRADFTAFYTGWNMVADGQGERLYDLELQSEYQARILQGNRFADNLLPFDYPPHTAVLLAPLGWLPRPVAFVLWLGAQVLLLAILLGQLNRLTRGWGKTERLLIFVTVLAFPPLLLNFLLGSFSLLLTVCVLAFSEALRANRPVSAGLSLVVGSVKPQSLILPGLALLGGRRWKALGTAALTGTGLAILATGILGWHTWVDFWQVIREMASLNNRFGIAPADMLNFKNVLLFLLGEERFELVNLLSIAALAGSGLFTLWLWGAPGGDTPQRFDLKLALTLTLGLLFSLHLYPQDSLMLIVPAILFYRYLRQNQRPRRLYAAFLLTCPLIFLVSEFIIERQAGFRLPVLAIGLLAGWISLTLWQNYTAKA